MHIFIWVMVLLFTLKLPIATQAKGLPEIVIINQVRGGECCDSGAVGHFKAQLEAVTRLGLKSAFVFRYDALDDPAYMEAASLAKSPDVQYGLFLEIVPSLASAASVTYRGSPDTWYQAQNAYTVGYSIDDRKRILDAAFARFKHRLGYHPKIVTSWIIDTQSADYMRDRYGVEAIQMTREQYGTDSYTLYGGPSHYPYMASRNWLFMPTDNPSQGLRILRQTVTDPVENHGDTHSQSTSQPNDYVRGHRDFSYFKKLVDNALFGQEQPGYALLGLENSMAAVHQDEYRRQLEYVEDLVKTARAVTALPTQVAPRHGLSVYRGESYGITAHNITTSRYRLRLIQHPTRLQITDLRLYDGAAKDPYDTHAAKREAFFVAPFLIDASRLRTEANSKASMHGNSFMRIQQDYNDVTNTGITIPTANCKSRLLDGRYLIQCDDDVNLSFHNDWFELPQKATYDNYKSRDFVTKSDSSELSFIHDGKPIFGFNKKCGVKTCIYKPFFQTGIESILHEKLYPFFYPEQVDRTLSDRNTLTYAYNSASILNRNPIRIIVEPHDIRNFQTILEQEPIVETSKRSRIEVVGELTKSKYKYIDIYPKKPGLNTTSIKIKHRGVDLTRHITTYTALNCKTQTTTCIMRPDLLIGYLATKVYESKYVPKALDN